MQNDLTKLKSVIQIQGHAIKIILFAKDILFLQEKWFQLYSYNPCCNRASNLSQQHCVGVNLPEYTFYFCLNCLFLNLISYAIRVENLFFSLPSPLKKKRFLCRIGLYGCYNFNCSRSVIQYRTACDNSASCQARLRLLEGKISFFNTYWDKFNIATR